jgi:hypothetical protein
VQEGGRVYKPRTTVLTNSVNYLDEEQLAYMKAELKDLFLFFGYGKYESQPGDALYIYPDEEER